MEGMSVSSVGQSDVATLSFEQARDELVRVVAELEQGAPTLEQSLALWERGEALAERCEEWLLGAKRRLDAARPSVSAGAGGNDGRGPSAAAGGVPRGTAKMMTTTTMRVAMSAAMRLRVVWLER